MKPRPIRTPIRPKALPIPRPTERDWYANERIKDFMNPEVEIEEEDDVQTTDGIGFIHYEEENPDLYLATDGSSNAWTWARRRTRR